MDLRSNRFALGVLVLLHFVLALAYAFATPYNKQGKYPLSSIDFSRPAFRTPYPMDDLPRPPRRPIIPDIGAPDELEHVDYVQYLVDGHGFPVLDPANPNSGAGYQSHQPPLFYMIETAIVKLTGQSDLSQFAWGGFVLRAVNVLVGCSNVVGVFFLGLWGFGKKEFGLAGAAFVALLPMNLALSGAVSNDPLLFSLCTWTLATAALSCKLGWNLKRGVTLGVLLGLALLTKTTAIALAPAVLIAAYLSGAPRPPIRVALAAAGIALLLALPWWIRNQSLYGDPFAMKAFNLAFVNSPTRASLGLGWGPYISTVFLLTWNSFIGVFGYMDIPLPTVVSGIFAGVLTIMALGGFLALRKPEWKEGRPTVVMNATFICLVVLSYVAFNVRYFQGQARYLFPAIGPMGLGFGFGLVYFARERWKLSFVSWIVALTFFNLWIVTQYLPDEFNGRRPDFIPRGGRTATGFNTAQELFNV